MVTVAFTIFLLVVKNMGVLGVLYARLIGFILTLIILSYVTRKEFVFSFSATQLKLLFGFSIFIIPANFSALVLNMSNRYFLEIYQGLDDVGLFSLGAKIAAVIPFLFTEPIKKAFSPYLFELSDEPEKCKKLLSSFLKQFLIILSTIALIFSLLSKELIMIMSEASFHEGYNVVFLLSMSYIFLGVSAIIVLGIHITRKTWIISIIFPISAIINVLLNILLIPDYGRIGAAVATLISIIIINLLYFYALHKVYPTNFKYLQYLKILFMVVVFNSIGSNLEFGIIINIILKIGIVISFIFTLFLIRVFTKEELKKSKLFLSRLLVWN